MSVFQTEDASSILVTCTIKIMLDKAIRHKKEYRKEYRGSARFDRSCINNKSCAYCKQNRTYNNKRRELIAKQEVEEYYLDEWYYYHGGYYKRYTCKYDNVDIA